MWQKGIMASFDVHIMVEFDRLNRTKIFSQNCLCEGLGLKKVPFQYEAQCYQLDERHIRRGPVDTSWLAIEETIAFFFHHSAVGNYDSERYRTVV